MRSKVIGLLLIAAVAASAGWLLFRQQKAQASVARITRDGLLIEEIDLERVTEPRTLTLEDGRGRNTVLVERGRICVSEADCPDQICVKQGWISDGTVPIVCLPHRLVIEITGDGGDVDGAAG